MKLKPNIKALTTVAGLMLATGSANAVSTFSTNFQQTIGSEQHPDTTIEGGPFNVSVNDNNAGYAAINYRLPGTNTDGADYERDFTEPVVSYSFLGGVNNVLNVVRGNSDFINYTTTDTSFDSFGQSQLQLWTTSDPGTDLTNPSTTRDSAGVGYRSFGQAVATVDISALATGTVNVFYGAFSSTPLLSAIMKDTDGAGPDITITNAHLNGDQANRAEYYVAELGFVNDAGYDVIEYTWLANGTDDTGNGRGLGTVLTGTAVPEPSSTALLGLGGLALILRRRK